MKMTLKVIGEYVGHILAYPERHNLDEYDVEAIKNILSHAEECPSCKQVEEAVGKLKEEIEKLQPLKYDRIREGEIFGLERALTLLTEKD